VHFLVAHAHRQMCLVRGSDDAEHCVAFGETLLQTREIKTSINEGLDISDSSM
jgi:hypothetical protein